jgi:hypothetical protein
MFGWGIALLIIGLGSLVMPMLGYQFTLMELVADFQPWAGIAVAVAGGLLITLGMSRRPRPSVVAPQPASSGRASGKDEPGAG